MSFWGPGLDDFTTVCRLCKLLWLMPLNATADLTIKPPEDTGETDNDSASLLENTRFDPPDTSTQAMLGSAQVQTNVQQPNAQAPARIKRGRSLDPDADLSQTKVQKIEEDERERREGIEREAGERQKMLEDLQKAKQENQGKDDTFIA